MFRRELELAHHHGAQLLLDLDRATTGEALADWEHMVKYAELALDSAWKMESALGAFVAIDDTQARVTGYLESKDAARRAFTLLKEGLRGADETLRRSQFQLEDYLIGLHDRALAAQRLVDVALGRAPVESDWRYQGEEASAHQGETPRATVVVARDPQPTLSLDRVRNLVAAALEPLGGMAAFVQPGQTVLIKPNLTLFFLAEEGVTTDPRVVGALVRLAKEAGAARVMVGESSGGGTLTLEAMQVTGLADAARREGAELVDFQTSEQREVEVRGKVIDRILMPVPLLEADVIINAPKAKTHHMDFISCALKNWVGVLRPDVREAHHDWNTYQEYVDLMSAVRPALNVVDALYVGEGDGPGATTGRFYGGIVASTDPVATDATVARLLGFNPRRVGFVRVGQENGLGIADAGRIRVVGMPLEEARIEARAPRLGVDYFGANVIVGSGVSRPGTLDHFKSVADIWYQMGVWPTIITLKGRPTIMIGDAEDPLFDRHLREGPYVVIDDAAQPKYKHHPQVTFIPGHPALHNILPLLMEGLGVAQTGRTTFELMKILRNLESSLQYSGEPTTVLAAAPAAIRRLPVFAQYATLGVLAFGLILALVWSGVGTLRKWRRG